MGGEPWKGKEGRPRRRALDEVTLLAMVEVVVWRKVMDFGECEMSDAAASRLLLLHGARLWRPGRGG